ncbi:MAG: alpha/beta hydrolase [Alphaproteobacteria bacterium]|nr:alpha/beta hydrolase [Alphaproteobacteria bacterium]
MPNNPHEFTTEDVEYIRHGDTRLIARLYKPKGEGPFPAVIDLHGGAWTSGDLTGTQGLDETLARNGFVVASLNFRHAADGYPSSLIDINYAVRWAKARARELKIDPSRIGIAGQSSGGHLAMLAAMRPKDSRYASAPLPAGSPAVDATVQAVAMSWPVINPLSRYRNAQKLAKGPNPPAFSIGMKEKHDTYWKTEAAMAEGNPILMLERGEKVTMPPALWVQGRPDIVHDYHDDDSDFPGNEPERFVSNYRKAGGDIEIVYVDNERRSTNASFDPIAAFFKKHLG